MTTAKRATICATERDFYKHWISADLRYGDTDRQGHVNNAVFCTLLESGRVDMLIADGKLVCESGQAFVLARLSLDYLAEMNYPGRVEVGSRVLSVGNSSFKVGQALFKDGVCCSTAESVVVLTDEGTRKSVPLTAGVRAALETFS